MADLRYSKEGQVNIHSPALLIVSKEAGNVHVCAQNLGMKTSVSRSTCE